MPPEPQSIFHGAHNVRMRDLVVAPDANEVIVVNEAGMQMSERGSSVDTLPTPGSESSQISPISCDTPVRDFFNAPNATVIVVNKGGVLNKLPKHPDMSPKQGEYVPDSRKSDIEVLCGQALNGSDLVLCVHGPAGIGKTTLACYLSDTFRSDNRLAASIFLGDFPADLPGPETIIRMVAREIGSIHLRAIPKIAQAMEQCHGTLLENQLKKYILEPLQSLNYSQPFIIIIDAIDEWQDHLTFLKALYCLNCHSHILKFMVTSRLNPCASHLNPDIKRIPIFMYSLGPISKEFVAAYFHKHLGNVSWEDGQKATPGDVEKLTELSDGLPIWAATVIQLLSHRFSKLPPHKILKDIVGSRHQFGGNDGLGTLYWNTLSHLFSAQDDRRQFQQYFGATSILQEPLSLSDFSRISGISPHLIHSIQFSLSAFQTRSLPSGSEKRVYPAKMLFHQSFIDYVQDTSRGGSFFISVSDAHSTLGLTCLNQLDSLQSLPSASYLCARQFYAVKYWLFHVYKGTPRLKDQWSKTEHHSTLLKITTEIQQKWAMLFLESLMFQDTNPRIKQIGQGSNMGQILETLANSLHEKGDDCWKFQVACLEIAVRINGGDVGAWTSLGHCYKQKGDRTGNLQMYEEAVKAFRQALQVQTKSLGRFLTAFLLCFRQHGNINFLNSAAHKALPLFSRAHPNRSTLINNLGNALQSVHVCNGDIEILAEAISFYHQALILCPPSHPDRFMSLSNLAVALRNLHGCNGDIKTLTEAISLLHKALALCPKSHPNYSMLLNNLAFALQSLYGHNRDVKTLTEAISFHYQALELRPTPHPDRSMSLNNLALALQSRYGSNGDVKALTEAISLHHEALLLRPAPHPKRSMSLNNLASALHSFYGHNGDVKTLTEAISLLHQALELQPAPHPDRSMSLSNLGNALRNLYGCNGEVATLVEAISLHHQALALRPTPHPNRFLSLNSLAHALHCLHEHNGDAETLAEALPLYYEALSLCPPHHLHRSMLLNNLGHALQSRYECKNDIEDLTKAISLHHQALALRPASHPDRYMSLNHLACALHSLYEQNSDTTMLAEPILLHRQALALCPAPHPKRSMSLNNLASVLQSLYRCNNDVATLTEAVSLHREALVLRPLPHPDHAQSLQNLANALLFQFEQSKAIAYLDESILLSRKALYQHLSGTRHEMHAVEALVQLLEKSYEETGDNQDDGEIRDLKARLAGFATENPQK